MNDQIKERVKIIDSYKSLINQEDKSSEKQMSFLKWFGISEFLIGIILLLFLIYVSAKSVFSTGSADIRWDKAGLLVLLIISFVARIPATLIEYIIKKHKKEIEFLSIEFDDAINADLKRILRRQGSLLKRLLTDGIPVLIIMVAAFFQYFEFNPYWDIFAYVVFVYAVFMLIKIYFDIKTISDNINRIKKG